MERVRGRFAHARERGGNLGAHQLGRPRHAVGNCARLVLGHPLGIRIALDKIKIDVGQAEAGSVDNAQGFGDLDHGPRRRKPAVRQAGLLVSPYFLLGIIQAGSAQAGVIRSSGATSALARPPHR